MSTQTACGTETTRYKTTNKMGDKDGFFADNGKVYVNGNPIDMKPTEGSFEIDQSDLDALDGKYGQNDFKPSTASISFEFNVTKQALRKLFPRPHLPRKKKKALKKMMMPYAENMYELCGERKQRYVTINWYAFWIKVNRNKLAKKRKPMWPNSEGYINQLEKAYQQIKSDK